MLKAVDLLLAGGAIRKKEPEAALTGSIRPVVVPPPGVD
jgi:hypothetical protein